MTPATAVKPALARWVASLESGSLTPPISANMVAHMKTTIEIADALLEEARRVADAEGLTLRTLVEAGLRRELAGRPGKRRFELRRASFRGEGLQAGLSEGSWEQIRELAYEGCGG